MANIAPRPLVAGNWKMNGSIGMLKEPRLLAGMLKDVKLRCDVMVCPPAILIRKVTSGGVVSIFAGSATGGFVDGTGAAARFNHPVAVATDSSGNVCHAAASGAHTGDISAEMLKEAGCSAVIVGHSERRTNHGETDEVVTRKAAAAHRAGLTAIICIGETLDERKGGKALEVVSRQLKSSLPQGATAANTVIAYEPVWAIGTGLTPTTAEVAEVHTHIRAELGKLMPREAEGVRILYGGSVKPSNAVDLMSAANVNGALVGGASLKAADFLGIIKAYA
jgi:triosephosphate isomerase